MKILYITNGITGPGGLERVLSIKTSELIDSFYHDVHVLALNEYDMEPFYRFNPRVVLHSINVLGTGILYGWNYIVGIRRLVNMIKPDIISVCDDGMKGFLLPIVLGKDCPIIYERHVSKQIFLENASMLAKINSYLKFKILDKLGNNFSSFVVLTDNNAKEWRIKNLKVIPNPTSFYPSESSSLTGKTVIAVGKQGRQKAYDRLLKAWMLVNKVFPEWQLTIYGKEDPEAQLRELANGLNISSSVFFYPPEKNIQAKYLESSIYVMSSRFEGFGMVLIEAMACGVPCISFDCPHGPSDIITDKNDGMLIANGDIEGLAQAIILLIDDESLRVKMGENAKKNVQRYLPEKIMNEWEQLFRSLVV